MAEAEGSKQSNKQVKKRTRNPSGRYIFAKSATINLRYGLKCISYAVETYNFVHFNLSFKLFFSICQLSVRLCLCFYFRMETRKKKTAEGGWKSIREQQR